MKEAGYGAKDIDLVLSMLGPDGTRAAAALGLMTQLRSEDFDRDIAALLCCPCLALVLMLSCCSRSEGFDRDAEAWKAWLVAKYLG